MFSIFYFFNYTIYKYRLQPSIPSAITTKSKTKLSAQGGVGPNSLKQSSEGSTLGSANDDSHGNESPVQREIPSISTRLRKKSQKKHPIVKSNYTYVLLILHNIRILQIKY